MNLLATLLLFYVLVFWPQGMWDLGSLTRDGTHTPCIGRRSLNHWTTREVPVIALNLFLSRKTEIGSRVQLCERVRRKEGVTHLTLPLAPQVCDEEWHHYVLNVEIPSVTLYVDGVPHEPFSVTEDYPLHPSKIETQLVVGACWQGNSHGYPLSPQSQGAILFLCCVDINRSRLFSVFSFLAVLSFIFSFLCLSGGIAVQGSGAAL